MRNRFLGVLDTFQRGDHGPTAIQDILQSVKESYNLSQLACVNYYGSSTYKSYYAERTSLRRTGLVPILNIQKADPVLEIRRDNFAVTDDVAGFRRMGNFGLRLCVERSPSTRTTLLAMSDLPEKQWTRLRPFYFRDLLIFAHLFNNLVFRSHGVEDPRIKLSGRERECIESVAKGLRPKQIAGVLGISEHAVRLYIRRARAKLNATTMSEATTKALQYGLISGV
ncbi:helix-turn-helix transcriptional regulator [Agrobacterium cavarae]|uniref:helix-turn-helix transcriptional regulator n=1 Tax=Agrobacterium cavarae TaxID=2528239 RepID=UPI003FCF7B1E